MDGKATPPPLPPPTPKAKAYPGFRDGVYGGFELIAVDEPKRTVRVRLTTMGQTREVEVSAIDEAKVFTANDLVGDFSSLHYGQRLSMCLRKKCDDEVVASAIFIERSR